MGAVMGSKNLKAVIVKGTRPIPQADPAAMKALGTGWSRGIRWLDLEVTRQSGGRPALAFSGVAAKLASGMGVRRVALSLTHTATQAVAQVILED